MEITKLCDVDGVHRFNVIDYDGYRFSEMTPDKNPPQHMENLKTLTFKGNEVCIASYPKSGTHWVYEVVYMLRNNKADFHTEMLPNFDFTPAEYIKNVYTGGLYVSHLYPRHFPPPFLKKWCKIIKIVRNPKAVVVSLFNFLKRTKAAPILADISFKKFLDMCLKGDVYHGSWLSWMTSWKDFQNQNPQYPILTLYYEDMKVDLEKSVREISAFLGTECSSELLHEIATKCEFTAMSKHKHDHVPDAMSTLTDVQNQHIFYGKGESDDWKNVFTVCENEEFNQHIKKALSELDLNISY